MVTKVSLHRPNGPVILPNFRAAPCLVHQHFKSDHGTTSAPKTADLECERKFIITDLLRTRLKQGHTIQNLQFTKFKTNIFQDKYFDIGGRLLDRGIWLRLRTDTPDVPQSGVWEAKVRIGERSDYINSKFEEVSGEKAVYSTIKKWLPLFGLHVLKLLGYQEITVAISTEREIWVSAVPLSEVEKCVPFEHVVGELEATSIVQMGDDIEANETIKKEELARMDSMIKGFMVNQDLFPTQPDPVGKLSAYFEWKEKVEQEERRQEIETAKMKFFKR